MFVEVKSVSNQQQTQFVDCGQGYSLLRCNGTGAGRFFSSSEVEKFSEKLEDAYKNGKIPTEDYEDANDALRYRSYFGQDKDRAVFIYCHPRITNQTKKRKRDSKATAEILNFPECRNWQWGENDQIIRLNEEYGFYLYCKFPSEISQLILGYVNMAGDLFGLAFVCFPNGLRNLNSIQTIPKSFQTELQDEWIKVLNASLKCLTVDKQKGTISLSNVTGIKIQANLKEVNCNLHHERVSLRFSLIHVRFGDLLSVEANDLPLINDSKVFTNHKVVCTKSLPRQYLICPHGLHFEFGET
jgi:hypothetical protein